MSDWFGMDNGSVWILMYLFEVRVDDYWSGVRVIIKV